eukprot:jgi/Chlat1/5276/Chrsp35S05234
MCDIHLQQQQQQQLSPTILMTSLSAATASARVAAAARVRERDAQHHQPASSFPSHCVLRARLHSRPVRGRKTLRLSGSHTASERCFS